MLSPQKKAVALDLATGVTQRASARRHGLHFMTITLWKRRDEFVLEIERLRRRFRRVAKQEK